MNSPSPSPTPKNPTPSPSTPPHHRLTLPSLCNDILYIICDFLSHPPCAPSTPLKNLSLTNRRLHAFTSPLLFKSLVLNMPLKLYAATPLPHHHAHALTLDLFGSMWWWCSGDYVSGSDARDLFWLMGSLPELRVLHVRMMSRSVDLFAAAFNARAAAPVEMFVLRGVQELVVSNSAAFLASHCPDLRRLVLRNGDACAVEVYPPLAERLAPLHPGLRAAGAGVNRALTQFDAAASWTGSEVDFLVETFPALTHVALRTESFCYRASLGTIVEILSQLRFLAVLRLAKIARLDMGYVRVWKRRIFDCKTDAARRALWVENERSRVEAENAVARMVFGSLAGLRECWVGEKRVARKMGEGGVGMGLRWVWERRKKEVEKVEEGGLSEPVLYVQYKAERAAVVRRSEVCM